jgi:glycosyltransferase involved in cell wall biosynthesis
VNFACRVLYGEQDAIGMMNVLSVSNSSVASIGVIIPTCNRADALILCLEHLERQTTDDFEVVVVDDGSIDSTLGRLQEFQRQTPLRLRYVRQANSGPARARNLAISMMRSPICLMIGDDIFVSPDFVETHLQLHLQQPELRIAGLGLTRWNETGQTVTKFMRWLDASGNQFAYGDLLSGTPPSWKHFYTSNLSVKTELLKRYPFDMTFPHAAMEDMELGYRIQTQHCLELVFIPTAVAYHLHPTDFRKACRRMLMVGPSARHLYELWPQAQPAAPGKLRQSIFDIFLRNRWLLKALVLFSDLLTRVWCPNPFMKIALKVHYLIGYSAPHSKS